MELTREQLGPELGAGGRYRDLRFNARRASAALRMTPSFIILGAMRAGTTSLFRYLTDHPQVLAPFNKEVHYFDVSYQSGWDWYLAHFPLRATQRLHPGAITGEASPYYLYHPDVARRVRQALPEVRLLVVLRHPVDRAFSHYKQKVQRKFEQLSFEQALDAEEERLRGEAERLLADESYVSPAHQHFSYLDRGIYVDQLQRWHAHFPREQLLILNSEDFYARPAEAMARVHEFLGLPAWQGGDYKPHNAIPSKGMLPETRARLLDFYAPHNERLYKYLGVRYDWEV